MLIAKNTHGVTSVFKARGFDRERLGKVSGSSLERKPKKDKQLKKHPLNKPSITKKKSERKAKPMSPRTKTKIRRKVLAFSAIHNDLSFVTLTFVNKVSEELAVQILAKFLENVSKRSKDFQYIWVAEKQTQNKAFPDNIHFHLITNKYWKKERWRKYWIELQAKHGILPRDNNFKLTFSFDVRGIKSANARAIASYLTKYVTKSKGEFRCQTWNCSKKISELNTHFYDDLSFLKTIDKMERAGLLEDKRKCYQSDFYATHLIPLDRRVLKLYNPIDEANKKIWNSELKKIKHHARP